MKAKRTAWMALAAALLSALIWGGFYIRTGIRGDGKYRK